MFEAESDPVSSGGEQLGERQQMQLGSDSPSLLLQRMTRFVTSSELLTEHRRHQKQERDHERNEDDSAEECQEFGDGFGAAEAVDEAENTGGQDRDEKLEILIEITIAASNHSNGFVQSIELSFEHLVVRSGRTEAEGHLGDSFGFLGDAGH